MSLCVCLFTRLWGGVGGDLEALAETRSPGYQAGKLEQLGQQVS